MKGWFDAFRTDGGPTLYSYSNRTPVTGDVPTITLYVFFFTLFIAFVIIFPGVRKERFTTFLSVTLSLFVGSSILISKYGSGWHVAETTIMSYYRSFSTEKLYADLGVHIGFMHFNVTLQGRSTTNDSLPGEDIDFNERFHWISATDIQDEFREALVKGLPYPILTIAEYFSLDDEGFCWGRQYRLAGYYSSILLWASTASWLLMNLLIVVVPRYGAYQMVITGGLMLSTNLVYYLLIPAKPLMIRFEDSFLMFQFGWCFWLIFVAGCLCTAVGSVISMLDLLFPNKFSTILEVDYDTPYDRHIIIEESHGTRKKKGKRSLEEPDLGIGKKILRTLSNKKEKPENEEFDIRFAHSHFDGLDNRGFEMDPPKSPWRYPHIMFNKPMLNGDRKLLARNGGHNALLSSAFVKNPALARLAAPNPISKSPKSVSFRRASRLETSYAPEPLAKQTRSDSKDSSTSSGSSGFGILNSHDELPNFQSQFRPIQRSDSQQSGSSVSSFGLGLLSRQQSRRGIGAGNLSSPLQNLSNSNSNSNIFTFSQHIPLNLQKSGSNSPSSPLARRHLPLSRITLNQLHHHQQQHQHASNILGVGIHQLPRASIERKTSSSEGENSNPSSRRGSGNSTSTDASLKSRHTTITDSNYGYSNTMTDSSNSNGYDMSMKLVRNSMIPPIVSSEVPHLEKESSSRRGSKEKRNSRDDNEW